MWMNQLEKWLKILTTTFAFSSTWIHILWRKADLWVEGEGHVACCSWSPGQGRGGAVVGGRGVAWVGVAGRRGRGVGGAEGGGGGAVGVLGPAVLRRVRIVSWQGRCCPVLENGSMNVKVKFTPISNEMYRYSLTRFFILFLWKCKWWLLTAEYCKVRISC